MRPQDILAPMCMNEDRSIILSVLPINIRLNVCMYVCMNIYMYKNSRSGNLEVCSSDLLLSSKRFLSTNAEASQLMKTAEPYHIQAKSSQFRIFE